MPDIYVEVGPMGVVNDTTKVPAKYAAKAAGLMHAAAVKAVKATAGFTTDKTKGGPKGYRLDATLVEIKPTTLGGAPATTCKISGMVTTVPDKTMVSQSLTGSATVDGNKDPDVLFCIEAVIETSTTKDVLPLLKRLAKKP